MIAKFCDGPLDGVEIELAKTIDKVVVVDDDGAVVRYECDIVECLEDYAAGNQSPDCLLHVSRLPEDFDEELIEILVKPPNEPQTGA